MATRRSAGAPQPAFVLHQWDWSETSLVVDLFTRESGRVPVVAKGAKRPTSNLRAVLLPFQRILVTLGKPAADDSTEVVVLKSAEWGGGVIMPGGAGLLAGFYMNELLMKGLPRGDAHPQLFDAYAACIGALAVAGEEGAAAVLRGFELLLLRETGVLPELDHATLTGEPLRAAQRYALRAEAGLVAVPADDTAPTGAQWQALHAALEADDLAALSLACAQAAAPLKPQLRALVHYHLGHAPLRTREVMQRIHRLLETPPR